ncbi:A disintegrin and metalloproteinase with thrombospondin motifs 12-like isoform X2 [Gordionus sp. m RMFG-2023]|uniref:A disintegrin and metalloproteinase with thrombospondin motifs 12-like isoform X2 n=1 Tax=Gordionus sp. m RMFG-2023 TaxID=3053472 RepID=UPI0031FC86E4
MRLPYRASCGHQWTHTFLHIQGNAFPVHDIVTPEDLKIIQETKDTHVNLKLYPSDNVLSPDFYIEDRNGEKIEYSNPENFKFYRGYYENHPVGFFVKDIKKDTLQGMMEIDDQPFKIESHSILTDLTNSRLHRLIALKKDIIANVKDYINVGHTTNHNYSRKVAKQSTYYIEGSFYKDLRFPLSVTDHELMIYASQVDFILREPTIQKKIYFVLKSIKNYNGTPIYANHQIGTFCDETKNSRVQNQEDVSFLISSSWAGQYRVLGYANLEAICKVEVSCSLISPTSTDTGITIAHELGHLLGCKHDMDNACNSLSVAGIMHYETKLPRNQIWSTCSAREIDTYFSKGNVSCLENGERYKATAIPLHNIDFQKMCSTFGANIRYEIQKSTCATITCLGQGYSYEIPQFINGLPCNDDNTLSNTETNSACNKGRCTSKSDFNNDQKTPDIVTCWDKADYSYCNQVVSRKLCLERDLGSFCAKSCNQCG